MASRHHVHHGLRHRIPVHGGEMAGMPIARTMPITATTTMSSISVNAPAPDRKDRRAGFPG